MENKDLCVAVIVGGSSPEREVSKKSGKAIYDAVCNLGYKSKIIDPAYGINQPSQIEDFFSPSEIFSIETPCFFAS